MGKYKELAYSYYNEAISLLEKHKITEAFYQLKKAVKIYDKDTEILNLLGLCCYYKCDFERANLIWKKSLILKDGDNPAAEYINLLKSKSFKSFLEEFNESIELIQKEDYSSAEAVLLKVNKKWDELIEPYLLLSLIYIKKKDYKKALKILNSAQKLDQNNIKITEYLIHVQKQLNKMETVPSTEKADRNKQGNIKNYAVGLKKIAVVSLIILLFLGFFYNQQQNNYSQQLTEIKNENDSLEEEKNDLKENFKKQAENIDNLKAEAADSNSKIETMAAENKDLNQQLSQIITHAEQKLFNSSLALYRKNNYSDAKNIFKNIYINGSADYLQKEALFFLANTELKLENRKKAVKYFKEYAEKYPGSNYHDEVIYNLALILNSSGKKEEAISYSKTLRKEYSQGIYNNQKINKILE